jgi:hypothetical protein
MMNLSKLIVTLLSISFVDPKSMSMCKDADCNLLYTPTTVRVSRCNCSETMHSFSYPKGYDSVYVNYSVTNPIKHDFYQEHTLIGSCPTGLLCTQRINLDPTKELTTIIREYEGQDQEPVLYSNDDYELNFDSF